MTIPRFSLSRSLLPAVSLLIVPQAVFGSDTEVLISRSFPRQVTDIVRRTLAEGVPPGLLKRMKRLKRILPMRGGSRRERVNAYFLEDTGTLLLKVPDQARIDPAAMTGTIGHELGHAAVFSLLTPGSLKRFAAENGSWDTGGPEQEPGDPGTVYDPFFLTPFAGVNHMPRSFPSTYSFHNVHEWFAENFAQYVLARMRLPASLPPSLKAAFQRL